MQAVLRLPRRLTLGIGTLAFIIGAAAGWTLIDSRTQVPPRAMQRSTVDLRTNPIGPGADKTDGVAAILDQFPFPALLPQTDDGSADVMTTWTRVAVEPAFAVQLQSGVMIMERPAESIAFPTDSFYQQLGEGLPGASVGEISGAPALLIQSSPELGNPSSVDTILQGVHISIVGTVGQDVSELVKLAEMIPATGSGTPIQDLSGD